MATATEGELTVRPPGDLQLQRAPQMVLPAVLQHQPVLQTEHPVQRGHPHPIICHHLPDPVRRDQGAAGVIVEAEAEAGALAEAAAEVEGAEEDNLFFNGYI